MRLKILFQYCQTVLGYSANFSGNADTTALFEGQTDHLVPSLYAALLEGDLFLMAGRTVGHSAIHGGPTLSGLSGGGHVGQRKQPLQSFVRKTVRTLTTEKVSV